MVKVFPQNLDPQACEDWTAYSLKLSCLSPSITHWDLYEILYEVDTKYCFIPKTNAYHNKRFAYVGFADKTAAEKAFHSHFRLKNHNL